jgi:acyl-coenzyme A thioesterase PaaI-like protein
MIYGFLAAVLPVWLLLTPRDYLSSFLKIGTIDLRVDYMGPAIGEYFDVRAEALRVGSRIGYTQMSLRGPQGELLSTGSGAYIVS